MTRGPLLAERRFFSVPDSLCGQLFLILFFGIVILQAANFDVVCGVQRLYVRQAEKSRAEHLAACWFLFDSMTAGQRRAALERMSGSRRPEKPREMVELLPAGPDWRDGTDSVARLLRMVEDSFGSAMRDVPPVVARTHENGAGIFPVHLPVLETAVRLSDGMWLKVTQPFNVDDRAVVWSQRLFVLAEAVVMLALTFLLLRRVTRPIRQLGLAAESFGKHPELSEPFPEKGVRELRDAARSFNRMRERICGNLAERDRMIAAMAHDLRTPLTRLQLRLDRVEPEILRRKLQKTVSDIRAIISQGLELARSLTTDESMTRLDLKAFLQSLADDYADVGHNVVMLASGRTGNDTVIVAARPLCLRRCLENILSNACAYGGGAWITLQEEEGRTAVSISDNGPGIPEEMLRRVFEPYFRLEPSRNRLSGGLGLGLTIARNMALLNNGDIELRNRPEGGLTARILLPRRDPAWRLSSG